MHTTNARELIRRWGRYLALVRRGETITVTHHDIPVAVLIGIDEYRRLVAAEGEGETNE